MVMGSDMGTPFFRKSSRNRPPIAALATAGSPGRAPGGRVRWRARSSSAMIETVPDTFPTLRVVVLDATDARALGEFYRLLLGYEYWPGYEPPPSGEPDRRGDEWLVLRDPSGAARLAIQHVDELPAATWPEPIVPQQLHLDMTVADVDELARQHDRALALGATRTRGPVAQPGRTALRVRRPGGPPVLHLRGARSFLTRSRP